MQKRGLARQKGQHKERRWLKDILGEAYTDEIDSSVSKKIGEEFVSRTDFNEKNDAVKRLEKDLKDRDKQLENLRSSEGNVACRLLTARGFNAKTAT